MVEPPFAQQMLAWVASSSAAAAVFKVLSLWCERKKSRNIELTIGDTTIKVAGVSEKEFFEFSNKVMESKERSVGKVSRMAAGVAQTPSSEVR